MTPMTPMTLPIDADHPAFAGHFPGRPILPGVVLLDCALRAVAAHCDDGRTGRWQVGTAKFLSFVAPGDAVRLEFEPAAMAGRYRLQVFAGDGDDARLAMSCALAFVDKSTI